jgi:hypothetical protein
MLQRRSTTPTRADRHNAVPRRGGRDEAFEINDHRARTGLVGGHNFGPSAAADIAQKVKPDDCKPNTRRFGRMTQQQGLLEPSRVAGSRWPVAKLLSYVLTDP